ncbi:nitrite reductase/ring-hydroxylating ferredoxin subunit [Bradyrhizobium sp. USDA 4454]
MTDYFGACPFCGREDGYIDDEAGRHWFICEAHKTKWCVGSGLFSVPDDAPEQERIAGQFKLRRFRTVNENGPRLVTCYGPL